MIDTFKFYLKSLNKQIKSMFNMSCVLTYQKVNEQLRINKSA